MVKSVSTCAYALMHQCVHMRTSSPVCLPSTGHCSVIPHFIAVIQDLSWNLGLTVLDILDKVGQSFFWLCSPQCQVQGYRVHFTCARDEPSVHRLHRECL